MLENYKNKIIIISIITVIIITIGIGYYLYQNNNEEEFFDFEENFEVNNEIIENVIEENRNRRKRKNCDTYYRASFKSRCYFFR